ncbi:MAG: enoyl-CoA hydratase-related protein [Sphingomonadales bacterium]
MSNPVSINRNGFIFEITLNRPKANAMDAATSCKMGEAFAEFRDDENFRVAIITGGGEKIFSAGWDLKAAANDGEHEGMDYGVGGFAGLTEMFDLNKPVICAMNGIAVGGGVELALACDLIVAAEHTEIFLPETMIGVLADAGGVQRLPRRIPYNIAMEMLLLGRKMGAQEAKHYGLFNAVVPGGEVMAKAREFATEIAQSAPLSVQAIKQVLRGIEDQSVEEAFKSIYGGNFPIYGKMLVSEDHEEGPKAFAEKREPNWKGC